MVHNTTRRFQENRPYTISASVFRWCVVWHFLSEGQVLCKPKEWCWLRLWEQERQAHTPDRYLFFQVPGGIKASPFRTGGPESSVATMQAVTLFEKQWQMGQHWSPLLASDIQVEATPPASAIGHPHGRVHVYSPLGHLGHPTSGLIMSVLGWLMTKTGHIILSI